MMCTIFAFQFLTFAFLSPGPIQLLIVAGIALLLFGNRLPSVMRSLGRGVVEFKKGVNGIEDDLDVTEKKAIKKDEDEE